MPPAPIVPPPVPGGIPRRHDLDALRATAMLLGILLHGALAYTGIGWLVMDDRSHPFFREFLWMVHGFRMPLFFMISGFFTAMLWRKRGLAALFKQRAKRILLPLLLFGVTIIPLTFAIIIGTGVFEAAWPRDPGRARHAESDTLWNAARNNDLEALAQHLESTDDIDRPDPAFQIPALHWAALNGSTGAARLLIKHGADVNARIEDGSTPLTHAAFTGRPEIVRLLIEHGADLNPVNHHRATPLDSLHSDWGTFAWVAGMMKLDEVDEQTLREGRDAAAGILRENGGKQRHELDPGARRVQRGHSGGHGPITAAYLSFSEWPGFHEPEILSHLWFLWYLCILLVPFGLYALLARAINWRGPPGWLFRFPLVLLWIVPLTMIPQWFQGLVVPSLGPDTSATLFPLPHVVVLYGVCFFFGALHFDCGDPQGKLGRYWWLSLPLAMCVVYPLCRAAVFEPDSGWITSFIPAAHVRLSAVLLQALFSWLMIFGMTGLFRKVCSRNNRVVRYLSDSSYWLYVTHLPLIIAAQFLLKRVDLPVVTKFAIVTLGTTAVLLAIYDLVIRYTWLGTLLNGRRRRP